MTDQQQNTCVGKYRGKVVHNVDPLLLGRIIATVPALPEPLLNWALPCFPYAGPNVGLFAVPPIGANVWIEFEGGDPAYAIWTGCFRDAEDRPSSTQLPPHLKMFRTDSITILLDDQAEAGGVSIEVSPPAVATPLSLRLSSTGVELRCGANMIRLTPEGIQIDAERIAATGDLTWTGTIAAEGAATLDGAVAVAGSLTVTGPVEIDGALQVAGAGTINGTPIL